MKIQTYEGGQIGGAPASTYTAQTRGPIVQSGLSIIGETIGQVSTMLGRQQDEIKQQDVMRKRAAEKIQYEDDKLIATNMYAKHRIEEEQALQDATLSMTAGDSTLVDRYQVDFDKRAKVWRDSLPTEQAKAIFDEDSINLKVGQTIAAIHSQGAEQIRFRKSALIDGAITESSQIGVAQDTSLSWTSIVQARMDLVNEANITQNDKAQVGDAITKHFSRSLVMADTQKNPQMAIDRIDSGYYSKLPHFNLYDDQLQQMRAYALSKTNEKNTKEVAAIKDAVDQWEAGLLNGTATKKDFPVTEAQLQMAYGDYGTKQVQGKAKALFASSVLLQGLATNSEQETANLLEAIKNDSGMQETVKGDVLKIVAGQWAKVVSERKSDPGLALANATKLVVPPNATFGDKLGARATISRKMGLTEDILLSKAEATSMVQNLTSGGAIATEAGLAKFSKELESYGSVMYTDRNGSVTNNSIHDIVMKQLYDAGSTGGKLDKEYMVAQFAQGTKFHAKFIEAIKQKDWTETYARLGGGKEGTVSRQIDEDIRASKPLANFIKHMSVSGGTQTADTIFNMIRKTAMVASTGGKSVVKEIVADMIEGQYHVASTYFAPRATAPDVNELESRMNYLKDNFQYPNGKKFSPSILSNTAINNKTEAAADMLSNPKNFSWLTNGSSTQAYLATYVPAAGQYLEVYDKEGKRILVNFSEVSRMEKESVPGITNIFKSKYRMR